VGSALENLHLFQTKFSWRQLKQLPSFAVIGSCLYFVSFGIPFQFKLDIPLLVLALFSVLAVYSSSRRRGIAKLPLILPVSLFIFATGISLLFSQDISRSLKLSVSLLPALLIFFLIVSHFKGIKDIRLLYVALSFTGLCLSFMLIRDMLFSREMDPFLWVSDIGSPILVVKNDVTFLAVIAPIPLSLLFRKPLGIAGVIAGLSVLLSIVVVGFFQSRVAMLTMVASITCFFTLIRPRTGLISCIVTFIIILLVDGIMGFPLIARFVQHWDGTGRIPLWLSAWKMFLDAPFLGHGPHTFVLHYNAYVKTLSLPPWLFVDHRVIPWAHNLFLEILAEQGIIGLMAFLWLLIAGISAAWQLRQGRNTDLRMFGIGTFASLVGFCFAALFELTFLRQWVVLIVFTSLGIIAQLTLLKNNMEEANYGG